MLVKGATGPWWWWCNHRPPCPRAPTSIMYGGLWCNVGLPAGVDRQVWRFLKPSALGRLIDLGGMGKFRQYVTLTSNITGPSTSDTLWKPQMLSSCDTAVCVNGTDVRTPTTTGCNDKAHLYVTARPGKASFQYMYTTRRVIVRSRGVSKPRDW